MDSTVVVQQWQDAANALDAERLVELSAPGIEVVGPRGSGRGHQLLRDWLSRAGLSLTTRRAFARGNVVVLEQRGVWRSFDSGSVTGEGTIASRFAVDADRVTRFQRYDDLDRALAEAGLAESDEVAPEGS